MSCSTAQIGTKSHKFGQKTLVVKKPRKMEGVKSFEDFNNHFEEDVNSDVGDVEPGPSVENQGNNSCVLVSST
jgi:hypothetical protein